MHYAHLNIAPSRTNTRHARTRWTLICGALFSALCLAVLVLAIQAHATIPPIAGVITSINASKRIVTARVSATGKTFQFSAPKPLISRLKVGQRVTVDFRTGLVSVAATPNCCRVVVNIPRLATLPTGGLGERPVAVTKKEAEDAHQGICDSEGQNYTPPRQCRAECTLTTTGPLPDPGDDQYSCTCIC